MHILDILCVLLQIIYVFIAIMLLIFIGITLTLAIINFSFELVTGGGFNGVIEYPFEWLWKESK